VVRRCWSRSQDHSAAPWPVAHAHGRPFTVGEQLCVLAHTSDLEADGKKLEAIAVSHIDFNAGGGKDVPLAKRGLTCARTAPGRPTTASVFMIPSNVLRRAS
jgi:hypothetical protein